MRQGIQSLCKALGTDGCYVFSICELAETIRKHVISMEGTFLRRTTEGIANGMIREADMFVLRPDLFLSLLTGKNFSVREEGAGYVPSADEFEILHGTLRKNDGRVSEHFRRPDWDSENGGIFTLKDKRIFKLIGKNEKI